MSNEKLVTVKEVSELLAVSSKTIYQWAELRHIPSYKVNGCLRFRINEVLSYVETCRVDTHAGRSLDRVKIRKGVN